VQIALKRIIDIAGAFTGLLLLSPILLLIALAVRLTSRGPVLFRQQRLGKGGTPFTLYKFRTIHHLAPRVVAPDGSMILQKNDSRLTSIGAPLRTYSLDELPQLFNVLKGDMSLVGPRPDEVIHLPHYGAMERCKLEVKPGLTSLAMVNGRNSIPWAERTRWEVQYLDNWSLWLDLKILLRTVPVVLLRRGVYNKDSESADKCVAGHQQ
jgi:lipopolysaccharide/colanic/teichoic acid biosynthesis glycosyltransferase